MKRASVLFGLVVATGVAHANPAPAPASSAAKSAAARTLPTGTRALLRQSPAPGIQLTRAVTTPTPARPRLDANGDAACGNVMSKSPDDTCTARTARTAQPNPKPRVVTPASSLTGRVATTTVAPAPLPIARPLVDADGDVAAGNVMKKTKR